MGVCFALALALCTGRSRALADQEEFPFPKEFKSPNGRFALVVFPRFSDETWRTEIAPDSEPGRLLQRYPKPGLYEVGESQPRWTVDWYAREAEVANDGVHVIRHGPWARSSSSEAISFLARGTLLRRYEVSDLVLFPDALPHSVSHLTWLEDSYFDERAMTLELRTLPGDRFLFDVRTGATISVDRAFTWRRGLFVGVPLALVLSLGGCWLFFRRRAGKAPADEALGT